MINNLPADVFINILSFNTESFLFSGILNKSMYTKTKTSIDSVLESRERLEEIIQSDFILPYNIFDIIASLDKPEMIDIILNNGIEWDHFCIESAVYNKSIKFIEFINSSDLFWMPENAFIWAVENRDLELAKFMFNSGFGFPDERCIIYAHEYEFVEFIEWIETIYKSNEYIMYNNIKNDDLENVILMWDNGFELSRLELITSCVNNSIKVFRFIIDLGILPGKKEYNYSCHMKRTFISGMILDMIEF